MWGFVAILVVLVLFYLLTQRNRRRQQAQRANLETQLTFGTEVMTTSGLYGTIVGRNEDATVQLAIAPGVQVKWAVAALREISSLPVQYRGEPGGSDPNSNPAGDTGDTGDTAN